MMLRTPDPEGSKKDPCSMLDHNFVVCPEDSDFLQCVHCDQMTWPISEIEHADSGKHRLDE